MSQVIRGHRKERVGIVVSDKMDKTVIVKVDRLFPHPMYKKIIRRSKKYHVHDAENMARQGDMVRICETRPISKNKCWLLAEILQKG